MSIKRLCIFNPEHDLCLANGNAHYVPPASAIDFARRDADLMLVLYPDSVCMSVYDPALTTDVLQQCEKLEMWGWNAVVKYELLRREAPARLLPTDEGVTAIRELQHRSTVLPLQPDCRAVTSVEEMELLLHDCREWVMKAPWSGAGRGLHWVNGALSDHDRHWVQKTVADQCCIIAEPWRKVTANVALEYRIGSGGQMDDLAFWGYSYFETVHGVYRENMRWDDDRIAAHFSRTELPSMKVSVERWLSDHIVGRYKGPLGVDLMVCIDGQVHVAEINFRHTMGMVAHERIKNIK